MSSVSQYTCRKMAMARAVSQCISPFDPESGKVEWKSLVPVSNTQGGFWLAQHGSGVHLEQTSVTRDSVLQNSTQSGPPSRRRVDNLLGVHYPRTNKKEAIFISENVEFSAKKALLQFQFNTTGLILAFFFSVTVTPFSDSENLNHFNILIYWVNSPPPIYNQFPLTVTATQCWLPPSARTPTSQLRVMDTTCLVWTPILSSPPQWLPKELFKKGGRERGEKTGKKAI